MSERKSQKAQLRSQDAIENIRDLLTDLSDVGVRELLEANDYEVLSPVPILRTILGVFKAGVSVRDMLFTRKILRFLAGFTEASDSTALKERIEASFENAETREAMSEKLLLALEQFDRISKADILSKLFLANLDNIISQQEFSKLTHALIQMDVDDIATLVELHENRVNKDVALDTLRSLVFLKLVSVSYLPKRATTGQIFPAVSNEGVNETFDIAHLGSKMAEIVKLPK